MAKRKRRSTSVSLASILAALKAKTITKRKRKTTKRKTTRRRRRKSSSKKRKGASSKSTPVGSRRKVKAKRRLL